jgi:hypothetical protein
MAKLTIVVDIGDGPDPILVDPHDVAEEIVDIYQEHARFNSATSYIVTFDSAEWVD